MRYRRNYLEGGTYFITMTLADRSSSVLVNNNAALKKSFKIVKESHPFAINAIVILPDHLHMLITLPDDDKDFSTRVRLIKSNFSRQVLRYEDISKSRMQRGERGIWQRRFWEHTIRDEKDFAFHVHYIHYNPVKHKHAINPVDWKFSSIHRYIREGILRADWSAS